MNACLKKRSIWNRKIERLGSDAFWQTASLCMKEKITAIIPAAGRGRRMGADTNKLLLEVSGQTVLSLTLDAFESCPLVDEVLIVANEQDIFSYKEIVSEKPFKKVRAIIRGGETRAESVYRGLLEAEGADIVVIHDGARACITPEIIEAVIVGSRETGAAIAAVRAVDTIKRTERDVILDTPPREALWQAQTPQVFRREILKAAMETATGTITDDASAVEQAGGRVKIVEANYQNIKITTPFDLLVAEAILNQRREMGCE